MTEIPTKEPPRVLVKPPSPTATCRTCRADVRVLEFTARAIAHHRLGTTVMDRCKATLCPDAVECPDATEYRTEVRAWQAERAATLAR